MLIQLVYRVYLYLLCFDLWKTAKKEGKKVLGHIQCEKNLNKEIKKITNSVENSA